MLISIIQNNGQVKQSSLYKAGVRDDVDASQRTTDHYYYVLDGQKLIGIGKNGRKMMVVNVFQVCEYGKR